MVHRNRYLLRRTLDNFLTSGRKCSGRPLQQLMLCNVAISVLVFCCFCFGCSAWLRLPRDPSLLPVVVINAVSVLLGLLLLAGQRLEHFPLRIGRVGALLLNSLLFMLLAATGGEDGTGFYWSYIVPTAAFFLIGLRAGTVFSVVYLLLTVLAGIHGPAKWPPLQVTLFSITYLAECVAIFLYELERSRSQMRLSRAHDRIRSSLESLEKARVAIDAANRAKSDFLAVMNHEIRTPMSSVMGMATLLADKTLDPESREYVETILSASHSLLSIVNDALDLTQIEAGHVTLHEADFPLEELMRGAYSMAQPNCLAKEINCRCEIASDLALSYHGDGGRLRQILLNLAGNAIKFTEKGGIAIHVSRDGGPDAQGREILRFGVRDTGPGISPEGRQKLFQPFSQLEAGATLAGSSGLGLSICKHLAELMGGEIGVDSTLGKGSDFWIRVPLPVAESQVESGERDSSAVGMVRPLKVLLSDDDRVNRRIIVRFLEKYGHRVDTAEDGRAALKKIPAGNYDLLITDLHMPEMGGIELLRAIRQGMVGQKFRHLPVVALTASIMDSDRQACMREGMNSFLVKPVGRGDLEAMLASLFEEGRAGQES